MICATVAPNCQASETAVSCETVITSLTCASGNFDLISRIAPKSKKYANARYSPLAVTTVTTVSPRHSCLFAGAS